MKKQKPLRGCMQALSWAGLVFSVFLIYAAVHLHNSLDVIIRIPFVIVFGGGGLMIGLSSLIYLIKGQITGV